MAEELQRDAVICEYKKQEISQFNGFTKSSEYHSSIAAARPQSFLAVIRVDHLNDCYCKTV
jgi:hypothetical protein